jgi:hypothetical protein
MRAVKALSHELNHLCRDEMCASALERTTLFIRGDQKWAMWFNICAGKPGLVLTSF